MGNPAIDPIQFGPTGQREGDVMSEEEFCYVCNGTGNVNDGRIGSRSRLPRWAAGDEERGGEERRPK